MDAATVSATLVHHFEYAASNPDPAHEMYHDDAMARRVSFGHGF